MRDEIGMTADGRHNRVSGEEEERLLRMRQKEIVAIDTSGSTTGDLSQWKSLFAIDEEERGGNSDSWRHKNYCPFGRGVIYSLVQLCGQVDSDAVKDMWVLTPDKQEVHLKDFPSNKRLLAAVGSKCRGLGLLYAKALFRRSMRNLFAAIADGCDPILLIVASNPRRLFKVQTLRELLCYICANAGEGCEEVFLKMLEIIIKKAPDAVRGRNLFGWSPLMYTLFRRKNLGYKKSLAELRMPRFEKRLIEAGCDPDEKDIFGVSWRMVASESYER